MSDGTIFAPDVKERPYRWEAATPAEAEAPLPCATDVVIVGAGFTGVAAACELARGGRDAAPQCRAPIVPSPERQHRAAAPVTAIIGPDLAFYDQLPRLFPQGRSESG